MKRIILYIAGALVLFVMGLGFGLFIVVINPSIQDVKNNRSETGSAERVMAEGESSDRVYLAEIVREPEKNAYYLRVQNRRHMTTIVFDRNLLPERTGTDPSFRIAWRGAHTVVWEVVRTDDESPEYYLFDILFYEYKRLEQAPDMFKAKKKKTLVDPGEIPLGTNEEKFMLSYYIDPGIDYRSLKTALPELTELQADAGQGLTEAFLPLEVLGYQAEVEFNFKDKVLYNYYYLFDPSETQDGLEMFSSLKEFFVERYGDYEEEYYQEEENYQVRQLFWEAEDIAISLVDNISLDSHYVRVSVKKK